MSKRIGFLTSVSVLWLASTPALAGGIVETPEPSTWALVLGGVAVAIIVGRLRK